MIEVQSLVDALADELARPVGVDDRRFRAVAYSSHPGEVDPVRIASILRREAPAEVRGWLREMGIEEAESTVRLAANPDLHMAARLCVPLRFDCMLFGYLWLIDEPALGDEELERVDCYAAEIAIALHRLRGRDSAERERELVARLLASNADETDELGDGALVRSSAYVVLAVTALYRTDDRGVTDTVLAHLADVVGEGRREANPKQLLADVTADPILCILATSGEVETTRRVERLALAASRNLAAECGWRPLVSSSGEVAARGDLSKAAEQAREALRIAVATGTPEPVVRWDELGAYRLIGALVRGRDPAGLLPPSLTRLLQSSHAEVMVTTLERYLDHGGDARAAAAELSIHRSSLYDRLHKIEDTAGVDLRSGEDRLELHLGLRLWRLAGDWASSRGERPYPKRSS